MVGGGAAGIIAAWRAGQLGAEVLLLEKTARLGTKILISGGGKCNITHDGEIQDVLRGFRPNEARFLRPACYRFTNKQIIEMLTTKGLEVYTRPDGRIFPVHQTAKDVVAILKGYLDDASVSVRLEAPVGGMEAQNGRIKSVIVSGEAIMASQVVLSVGGSSYPNSGTTGDGWKWAKDLGHTIQKVHAALAPIYLETPAADRSGVALRDCVLKARLNAKEIARWRGDMLFTHLGVSGPTVLGISRVVAERFSEGEVSLDADLTPDRSHEALTQDIVEWCKENPKKAISAVVADIMPSRLSVHLMDDAGVDGATPSGQLDKKSRNRLVANLKQWPLGRVRAVPLEKGEVVAGGVSLNEVDPHTMASLKVQGLYLCGEVLDIAGDVGGYNLQAAFASGFVAGESAAKSALNLDS